MLLEGGVKHTLVSRNRLGVLFLQQLHSRIVSYCEPDYQKSGTMVTRGLNLMWLEWCVYGNHKHAFFSTTLAEPSGEP